ncbi:MAG: hypothetical protein K8S16_17685 [Bacteroidales bacterium]|nr:hypothetical protein [Bacteroidales bacterium]
MNKLINKYGILLSVLYIIEYILLYFDIINYPFFGLIYHFVANIIVAIVVASDLKKNETKGPIIIWSTILFSILGVTLFLLKKIDKDKQASA